MTAWPITLADFRDSRKRIRPHLPQTPLRRYAPLDERVGAADGLATGDVYPLTFDTLREGLASFSIVTEAEIAESVRGILGTTHQLVEGAGRQVAIVLSGSNIDRPTLQRILDGAIQK